MVRVPPSPLCTYTIFKKLLGIITHNFSKINCETIYEKGSRYTLLVHLLCLGAFERIIPLASTHLVSHVLAFQEWRSREAAPKVRITSKVKFSSMYSVFCGNVYPNSLTCLPFSVASQRNIPKTRREGGNQDLSFLCQGEQGPLRKSGIVSS